MEENEYLKAYKTESFNWYFISRKNFFFNILDKYIIKKKNKILDIGSGTGIILKDLYKYGDVIGIDTSKKSIELCKSRNLNCRYGNAESLPFKDESFDIVTAFGVIEHVDDDQKVLNEITRVLKKNGYFMMECPAYKFLWSEHDVALHHKRRYTIKELKKKISKSGLEIEKISYIYFFIFFPVIILRVFRKIFRRMGNNGRSIESDPFDKIPKLLNKFLMMLGKLEAQILKKNKLPFGVSIICLAKKKS